MEKQVKYDLKLKILGYCMSNFKHGSKSTMYNIEVRESTETNPWTVKRSFDDFHQLEKDLKAILKSMNKSLDLPKVPAKSMLSVTKTSSLDKRMEKLNIFLYELSDSKFSELFSTLKFREFFDFQSQSQQASAN